MDQGSAVELVRQRLGESASPRLVEQLLRRTDSDPTLLETILDQVPPHADGLQRVPIRWPDSGVSSTLDSLPSAAREVIDLAAVVGREFDLAIVERVLPDADLLGALDLAGEIVEPLPGHVFSFRRALVREVCYDSLGPRRRAELHERVAAALSALGATSGARAATVVELAYHLSEAAALGGGERLDAAAAAAATAGATAAASGAYDLAAEYFAQATTFAGRSGWAPAQAGRLMVAAGTARLRAARTAHESSLGRAALTAAVRMGHRAHDAGLIAAAALGFGPRPTLGPLAPAAPSAPAGSSALAQAAPLGPVSSPLSGGASAATGERWEALNAAVEAAESLDASLNARLLARLAVETGRAELAVQANTLAHESGDPRAVAEAGLAVAQLTGDLMSLEHAARESVALADAELMARALDLQATFARGDAQLGLLHQLAALDESEASALVRWYARRAAHAAAVLSHDSSVEELARQALEAGRVVDVTARLLGRMTQSKSDTDHLTAREREVLAWALKGVSSKEIAEALVLGERTVETHLANIYRKLGVRGRVDLIMKFR